MANKIVVNTGKLWIGALCMAGGHPHLNSNVTLRLFTNNVTLARGTILSGLTEMSNANVPGYAAAALGVAVDGGIDGNNWDTWAWALITFQATGAIVGGPITAYGYYVTDNANTTLIWGENFSTPQVFTNSGDGFTLTPTFSFGSLFLN